MSSSTAMSMFLSKDEIANLTQKARSDAQRRELKAMGIAFLHRRDGSLAVLRAHVEQVMGGENRPAQVKMKEPELMP